MDLPDSMKLYSYLVLKIKIKTHSTSSKGSYIEGRELEVDSRKSRVEGRMSRVEGHRSKVRKSRSRVKSKGSKFKCRYVSHRSKKRSIFVGVCWLNTKTIIKGLIESCNTRKKCDFRLNKNTSFFRTIKKNIQTLYSDLLLLTLDLHFLILDL